MVKFTNRLWVRLVTVVLLIHAVLLPMLFYGLLFIVQRSHTDLFVSQVRNYSRTLADQFELGDALSSPKQTVALLDSVILSGQGVYAELLDGSQSLRSSLVPADQRDYPGDDFEFGSHGDDTYFISVPINRGQKSLTLRLGFDESSTVEQIAVAKRRILAAVLAFTALSIATVIWLATRIAAPMTELQNAARRIAGGNYNEHLESTSSIYEVRELNKHLEWMRQELVEANERTRQEMLERVAVDAQRRALEERLRHSERIATVGTLAGGIAHEFNNIMTPILLYSQSVLDELPGDSELHDDLRRVIAAAHRARSLVTRILTFSREMDTSNETAVNVKPIVLEVVALLRAIIPPTIDIIAIDGGDSAVVFGDPNLIHQLVMNLCTNAYQAMRTAGGRLSVSVQNNVKVTDERVPQGNHVLLEVQDTGHGMDAATAKRIFEPFFTTREVGEGTGLGLSVVHGIVTAMGGVIVVDSVLDRGTVIRAYFPAAEQRQAQLVTTPVSTGASA